MPLDDAGAPTTASSPSSPQPLIRSCIDNLDRAVQTDASLQTEQETLETCNAALVAWGRSRLYLGRSMSALKPDAPSVVQDAFGEYLNEFRDRWNEFAPTTGATTAGTMGSCIAALIALEDPDQPRVDATETADSCALARDNADAAALSLAFVCEALALGPDRREADRLTTDIEAFYLSWSLVAG